MEILSNFQYKKLFLPNITEKALSNFSEIQLYRLEEYLMDIVKPVVPYRTTFNFVIFVTQGRIKQHLDNLEYEAGEGGVIFIKQGAITATLELSDDLRGYFLAYENSVLSERELPMHKTSIFFISPYMQLDSLTTSTTIKLLSVLEQELLLANFEVNDVVVITLHLILVKLLSADTNGNSNLTTRSMEISLQFRDLLFKNHIEEKRVQFYAESLSVSVNYLNKCVKQVTQMSPKQWINEVDINYGKALLHSNMDVAEIAYLINFKTASHFSQLFRKLTGITPKVYRQKLEAEEYTIASGKNT